MEEIKIENSSSSHYNKDKSNIIFTPAVSKQRYTAVHELLTNTKWRESLNSVTEYGCSSYNFFPYLKNTSNIREINFVDLDDYILEERLFYIRPLLYDHFNKRTNPLKVNVFEGSISDPDLRILNSDAVVGIEIIEHLFPDTLQAVPYMIFYVIKPKVVIFTTPNADFNVALPNFKKFRHLDHKFEWTREQFESWASNITLRFPQYKVTFFGIGKGPEGTDFLGSCSQLALFVRKDILDSSYNPPISKCFCGQINLCNTSEDNLNHCLTCYPMQPFGICTYLTKSKEFKSIGKNDLNFYRLVGTIVYPHKEEDKRSKEERILDSIQDKIYDNSFKYRNEDGVAEIPLFKITTIFEGKLISEEEVKDILVHHGYEIKDCLMKNFNEESDEWISCVLHQIPITPSSSESGTESWGDEDYKLSDEKSLSDWDKETEITAVN
ncbi:small RNA 2'-O-methyltransferase-like isoform X3 [Harmonia axyridis]|uniref:small RNA 2'-O-methyltransferase-like isoform X3 n=1 Tax=Harmonia axyridis TaxID=115357 RepID=UPI001E275B7A|nr:small RNA 2'-O-methyltransferase-like isoform X3 [Harmonia axyridis]XP_045472293.1 small RNA 2'-O-methyltransferase-like isoform X3 [Harmonia axyridis]